MGQSGADATIGSGATAAGAAGPGYGLSSQGGSKLDNALDNYDGTAGAGVGAGAGAGYGASTGSSSGLTGASSATTGAYEGVGGGDALTGQGKLSLVRLLRRLD